MRLPAGALALVLTLTPACGRPGTGDAGAQPHADHAAQAPAAPAADRPAPRLNTAPAPEPTPPGMVWIPGGTYWRGCEGCGMPDALPLHLVELDGFWMDRTPVTNAEFARFVKATGYVTVAERELNPADYPGVPADKLVPGSAVFQATSEPVPLQNPLRWWTYVPGASWKRPFGKGSSLEGRADHPVVHVAFEDAQAYAAWAGKRLPTEAEFELAARGGLDRNLYAWGNDFRPGNRAVANTWQGRFPARDEGHDGYTGTSPVEAFPANGYGLYDMGGNVWHWCSDWYRPDTYAVIASGGSVAKNPQGPDGSYDPDEPGAAKRVVRGGSYLCTDQYCARFLVGSRGKAEVTSGTSNLSFRLVRSGLQGGGAGGQVLH
ncbi:MAG TPA: formylglycine-generating enzyme family protein [Vicinamibacterales bacterium]|nr:formylglycine-generating enzyme family protein [Vicinamibacterales bacterium]